MRPVPKHPGLGSIPLDQAVSHSRTSKAQARDGYRKADASRASPGPGCRSLGTTGAHPTCHSRHRDPSPVPQPRGMAAAGEAKHPHDGIGSLAPEDSNSIPTRGANTARPHGSQKSFTHHETPLLRAPHRALPSRCQPRAQAGEGILELKNPNPQGTARKREGKEKNNNKNGLKVFPSPRTPFPTFFLKNIIYLCIIKKSRHFNQ